MVFDNVNFTKLDKIRLLQRWLIIHSIIYYEIGDNVVSDSVYDHNSQQLSKALDKLPRIAKESYYSEVFSDFDPCTGMNLPSAMKRADPIHYNYLFEIALDVIKQHDRRQKEQREKYSPTKPDTKVVQKERSGADAKDWLKGNIGKR